MRGMDWLVGGLVSATLLLGARGAECQSPGERTSADALFEEGKRLLAEKRFADACARFEASQRLDPGVGTLLFLADCYDTVGRTASAWSTFREAASAARAGGQADRERVARERAAKLEQTLFKLTIVASAKVAAIPGIAVRRDGVMVSQDLWGVAVPVDPGTYHIEATAPGKLGWSTTLEVPVGKGSRVLEIPALRDAPPVAIPKARSPLPPRSVAEHRAPPPDRWPAARVVGLTTGILGLGGLGAGAVAGGIATSRVAVVNDRCPDTHCNDLETVRLSHEAGTTADISTALFVGGGAAVVLGATLFFAASPAAEKAPPATGWLAPNVGPGALGILGGGSF